MVKNFTVAELADARDLELGSSPWQVVDQQRIDAFAAATDDHQWIHVDPERAADGPFGRTIAHGYLTLALVPAMLKQLMVITDHQRGTNYGLDKVRFTAPVPVDAEVRLTAAVLTGERRPDGGVQYRVSLRVDLRGQERPALIGDSIYLTYGVDPVAAD